MKGIDPKAFLLFALQHFSIDVVSERENMVYLEKNYTIEIEGPQLFKLIHQGQVIAPFAQVEEMCRFLQQDMPLND